MPVQESRAGPAPGLQFGLQKRGPIHTAVPGRPQISQRAGVLSGLKNYICGTGLVAFGDLGLPSLHADMCVGDAKGGS